MMSWGFKGMPLFYIRDSRIANTIVLALKIRDLRSISRSRLKCTDRRKAVSQSHVSIADSLREGQTLVWLRKTLPSGKIVLPCKPRYRPRDKSFCQGRFAADSIFGQVILWTRISRMDELC